MRSLSVRPAPSTADVLAVILLTAVQPRLRGHGFETAEQAAERGKFDVALVLQRQFIWKGDFREQFEPDNVLL